MVTDVPVRCRCGQVRGRALGVSRSTGNRAICYCNDCKAFGRFLGTPGILDAAEGSDIFQIAPSMLRIDEGLDAIDCVRLSDKGMFRWYARCCKTPIGNMVGPRMPFIGVVQPFMDHAGDGRPRDEVIGASRGEIYARNAKGAPAEASDRPPPRMMLHIVRLLLTWWVGGRGFPSPFFDERTKEPRVTPRILRPEERAQLG